MRNLLPAKQILSFGKRHLGWIALGAAVCIACGMPASATLAAEAPVVGRCQVGQRTDTTATIEFPVTPAEGENLDVAVFYGKEDGGRTDNAWDNSVASLKPDPTKAPGAYTVVLDKLHPSTAYVYRVKVTTSAGTAWSALGEFSTREPATPWHIFLLRAVEILALLIAPSVVGFWLTNRWRMPDYGWKVALILSLITWSVCIVFTWPLKLGIDLSGGVVLVYEVDEKAEAEKLADLEASGQPISREEKEARAKLDMDKLVSAIALRVDPGGTRNIDIRTYGPKQIEVIIPRANPEEVRRIRDRISRAGTLEFRILADKRDHRHKTLVAQSTLSSDEKVYNTDGSEKLGWWVPVRPDEAAVLAKDPNAVIRTVNRHGKEVFETLVVNDPYNVTGGYLSNCRKDVDHETGRPCVLFYFNRAGAGRFGKFTGENEPVPESGLERKLGIILDGQLYSAPVIRERIGGEGRITGGDFTDESVQDLVDVLNAGSLPTALKKNPLSEQECGPTLGRDMIRRGTIATVLSLIGVFVFMTGYYRFAGLVASAAVVMNLFLLLSVMNVVKGFDMTLPGIAGFVLGLGMAVDANVLIFERMREELGRGATLRMAIRNGFDRALSVIIDSNLTGLITAVILYAIGTSQIKGFAVTLGLGIVFSMFTAVFCSRVVFDIGERKGWIKKLSMLHWIGPTRFDFMGRLSYFGVGLSLVLLTIGMVAVVAWGKGLLDIDFTGGESVQVLFKQPKKIDKVRKILLAAKDANGNEMFPDLTVTDTQIHGEPAGLRFIIDTSKEIDVKTPDKTTTDVVEEDLHKIFGDDLATNKMTVRSLATIGQAAPPAPAQPETSPPPGEPATSEQSRNDLPSPTLLAQADPTATPDEVAVEKPDTPPADVKPAEDKPLDNKPAAEPKTQESPSSPAAGAEAAPGPQPAPPSGEPAPAASRFEGGAKAVLRFDYGLDHETVKDLLTKQLAKLGLSTVAFDVDNEKYEPGDTEAYPEWTLRIQLPQDELNEKILKPIQEEMAAAPFFPSSSSVGGKVAGDMQEKAIIAVLLSLVTVCGYLWVRFQHLVYGLATVVALVHDVLITLGAVAVTAYVYPMVDTMKIGLTVLAAFLTIIGYSLNDTIVVFDRIREVKGKLPYLTKDTINASINQTLSRTLLTGTTTLLVLLILFYGGGGGLHAFAFTLLVGIITGTYSSVFVASPFLYWMIGRQTQKTA